MKTLLESLNNPQAPVLDLVQSATGLAEIGAEFHERSAEVFRAVLRDRVRSMVGCGQAAVGLAALGSYCLAEAVATLTALVTDRSLDHHRVMAVEALAGMGPQYRAMAGGHLLKMLGAPALRAHERYFGAIILAQLGPEFHPQAAAHLRRLIADHDRNVLSAVRRLVDLGPDLHAEAAQELHRLVDDPLTDESTRAGALGQLARLGVPHRASAVGRLRAELDDRDVSPTTRYVAARELVELGPEFHAEAATALLEIISGQPDGHVVCGAWSILATLGIQFCQPATDALLAILESPVVDALTVSDALRKLDFVAKGSQEPFAGALTHLLSDATRSDWARAFTTEHLVRLGGRFRSIGVSGFLELLHRGVATDLLLGQVVGNFVGSGIGRCVEVADAVLALMSDPTPGPTTAGSRHTRW